MTRNKVLAENVAHLKNTEKCKKKDFDHLEANFRWNSYMRFNKFCRKLQNLQNLQKTAKLMKSADNSKVQVICKKLQNLQNLQKFNDFKICPKIGAFNQKFGEKIIRKESWEIGEIFSYISSVKIRPLKWLKNAWKESDRFFGEIVVTRPCRRPAVGEWAHCKCRAGWRPAPPMSQKLCELNKLGIKFFAFISSLRQNSKGQYLADL